MYKPAAPQRSVQDCDRILASPASPFALEDRLIGSRRVKVYRNLPDSIRDYWLTAAQSFGQRKYLVYEDERLTYSETHERVLHLASLLHARGVKKGDRVALALRNTPEWIVAWWACHLLGAISVAVNAWLSPEAFFHCLSITEPAAILVDEERQQVLRSRVAELHKLGCRTLLVTRTSTAVAGFEPLSAALAAHAPSALPDIAIGPEDLACIFFTSGTTSLPKGVNSTQRQWMSNRWNTATGKARMILRRGEDLPKPDPNAEPPSVLLTVPLFHVIGNQSFLALMTAMGGSVILMHKFTPARAASLLLSEGCTMTGGVPNMVSAMLDELDRRPGAWDKVRLESLSYGGGPPSSSLPEEARQRAPGASASQGYGLTETNSVATTFAGDDYLARPTSCGLAALAVRIKIIPPTHDGPASSALSLAPGETGEICIHGPNVALGYWRDEEATRKAFDDEGWFRSGDLGYLDEEGFLYISDRAKDIIIRSGENISSVLVEDALLQHPAVRECAVVPVPCPQHGEQVAALVVLHPPSHPSRHRTSDVSEAALAAHCATLLPRHAVPALVLFPSRESGALEGEEEGGGLIKNATGKVLKKDLKAVAREEWERRGGAGKARTVPEGHEGDKEPSGTEWNGLRIRAKL
ncbi:hypothetical protein Rhopal_001056-T1 [Rhodotorula paludigena]|uniref:Long-chain-fatty-acid-CoA ligase n=1 Tax=Rhodotorula paludigena TaxID=86838 RepID=A0AAV5G6M7_9BASI|nr:hypothetical protein Rhopal_001056-T1 [Rhodotorula paludigena]